MFSSELPEFPVVRYLSTSDRLVTRNFLLQLSRPEVCCQFKTPVFIDVNCAWTYFRPALRLRQNKTRKAERKGSIFSSYKGYCGQIRNRSRKHIFSQHIWTGIKIVLNALQGEHINASKASHSQGHSHNHTFLS